MDLFPRARWLDEVEWFCSGDGGGDGGASGGDTGGPGDPSGMGGPEGAPSPGGASGYGEGGISSAAVGGWGDSGAGGDSGVGGGVSGGFGVTGGLSGFTGTQEAALAALQGYNPGLMADLSDRGFTGFTYHTAPATEYNPLTGVPTEGPQGFFSENPMGLGPAAYTSFDVSNPGRGVSEPTVGIPAFDLSSPGFEDAPPGPSFGVGETGTGQSGAGTTGVGPGGSVSGGFTGGSISGGTQGAADAAIGGSPGTTGPGSAADGNSGGTPGAMQVAVPGDFPAIPGAFAEPTITGRPAAPTSFGTINGRAINPNVPTYLRALGHIESTSNYATRTDAGRGRNGQHLGFALGRYQIMSGQLAEWTQQALGRAMTEREFLNDPEAQDRTAAYHFQGYLNQFGTPQLAAAAWMNPNAVARGVPGRPDRFGTTAQRHGVNFMNALTDIQRGRIFAAPLAVFGSPLSHAQTSPGATAPPRGYDPQLGLGHLADISTVPQPVPTPAPRPGDSFDSRFGGGFKGPAPGAIAGLVSQPVPAPRPGDTFDARFGFKGPFPESVRDVVPPVFSTPETRDTFDARFGTWPQVDTFDDRFGGFKAPPPPTEELPDIFPTLPPPPPPPPPVATPPVAPPPTVPPPPAIAGKGPGPIAGPGLSGNGILPFPGPMIPQGGNGIAPVPGGVQPINPNMIPPGGGLAALQAGSMKPLTPREMALLRMQGLA